MMLQWAFGGDHLEDPLHYESGDAEFAPNNLINSLTSNDFNLINSVPSDGNSNLLNSYGRS